MREGDAGPKEVEEPFLEVNNEDSDNGIIPYYANFPDVYGNLACIQESKNGLNIETPDDFRAFTINQKTAYALGKLLVRYGETGTIAEEGE